MLYKWLNDEHVYIYHIYRPWSSEVMPSYDMWLDVGCNFIYATKAILVINVGCNCFIVANWSYKLAFFF
jgi:hypothetical protein